MENKEIEKYIHFKNDDYQNYLKYQQIRSKELYYFVSKWLSQYYDKKPIDYEIVNDWVRYDKSLKDTLYIFISTFEEYFKTKILENFIFQNNKFYKKNENEKNKVNLEVWKKLNNWPKFIKSFYKQKKYQSLINYFLKNNLDSLSDINEKFNKKNLKKLNSLRNKVMHFSFIALPINKDIQKIEKYLKEIKEEISNLQKLLPEDWSTYFTEKFNLCTKDSDENKEKTINKKLDEKLIVVI